MNNQNQKFSIILTILFLLLTISCKDASDNEQNESPVPTDNVEIENEKEIKQVLVEPTDDSQDYEFIEEEPEIKISKREKELELLLNFRSSQNKRITDEYGLVQTYSVDKIYGDEIILGSTDEIRQIEEKQWHGYKLIISLREVTNDLKINGELQHQVKTFEQLYVVEHRFRFLYGSGVDYAKGANLAFEPDTESVEKRKKIFEEIHRRFAFRYEEPDTEWKQAYSNLIKNSGVLEINSYPEFSTIESQNKNTSDINVIEDI
ncbi:hypothetical protein [Christiangramia forsetii]|uniref:Secreted protein n=2 Tax=Christiangramia forsetii TaxID=411153 RepID=A0LZN5_CHRFK|nr:hypothetical protein [Christiangramia forsetii]GGG46443.1 hypothetical protein GCM10011532_32900 [Christiangramia forsetii]CAL65830.1 conserved hypothetical protein [Christiangramia forsetii KT0803]